MTRLTLVSLCLLLVSIFVDISNVRAAVDCDNWRSDIDKASSILFLAGDRDIQIPKTTDDVDEIYCKRHTSAIDSIREITRTCLRPFPKQVIGLLTFGSRKEVRACCKSDDEKRHFIESLECFNDKSNQNLLHDSFDQFILKIEGIRDSVAQDHLKIPHACCAYNSYILNLRSLFKDSCSTRSLDYLLNMTDRKVKDAFEFVCAGYTATDQWEEKCINLNHQAPVRTKTSGIPSARSVILPLVDIYTQSGSLPDERLDKLTSLVDKLAE